jgi:PKD repeat protein
MSFEITKDSNYAPVIVSFDASKSQVKNEDIVKFIWDYGDGTPIDQRDAIVPGHKYNKPGEYLVKVTAVTESGKKYSAQKKLILNPKPQTATITSSMKKAQVGQ